MQRTLDGGRLDGHARAARLEITSGTFALAASSTVGASTAALEVGAMNMNDIAFEQFMHELTLTYMAADDLLREDAVLRAEFSGQVELASFMQWQAQRILSSANSQEGK